MTTKNQTESSIQDSEIFKSIDKKGTCSIDAGRADRQINISDEVKCDQEIMFWNPFTEIHPEDWNDMIKADIRAMNRERGNL